MCAKGFEYRLRLVWIQSKSIPFDAPTSMRIKKNLNQDKTKRSGENQRHLLITQCIVVTFADDDQ